MVAPFLNDISDNRADVSRVSRSHNDSVPNGLEGNHAMGTVGVIDQIIAVEQICRLSCDAIKTKECDGCEGRAFMVGRRRR